MKQGEISSPAKTQRRHKATNLSLNRIIVERGAAVARELGYNLSEAVEELLQRLHEAAAKRPKQGRSDHLQIDFFDRVTPPAERPKKKPGA